MLLKYLALAACALSLAACGPTGCSTTGNGPPDAGTVTLSAKKAALAARGSHVMVCEGVRDAHTSGALSGEAFNEARQACITADDLLDVADAALLAGDTIRAAAAANAAFANLDTAQVISEAAPTTNPPATEPPT